MNFTSTIVFAKKDFKKDLYLKIAQQVQLLMESGYICTIYTNMPQKDIVVIEYASNNPADGQPYPYHLYPDEAKYISFYIAKKSLEQYKIEVEDLEESLSIINDIENLDDFTDDELEEIIDKKKNKKGGGHLN